MFIFLFSELQMIHHCEIVKRRRKKIEIEIKIETAIVKKTNHTNTKVTLHQNRRHRPHHRTVQTQLRPVAQMEATVRRMKNRISWIKVANRSRPAHQSQSRFQAIQMLSQPIQ